MIDSSLSTPLHGIVPPMITPLKDRDTLDVEGLERLVEHLVAGGVHGLFILGTSGETPCLSYRLRRELIGRVCRQIGDRLPVLVGVTDTSIVETLDLARCAAEAGANGVVLAPPYYFPLSQSELVGYVRRVAAELPLPLLLYNIPALTKVSFEPETVRQLLEVPRIVGLKDSSRQMDCFVAIRQVTRQRPDWSLLIGFEHLLADAIRAGGDGGVCAGANLSPRLLVDLYEAASTGCQDRLEEVHRALACQRRIYTVGQGATASIQGIKCALALRGICQDRMAEPFPGLSAEQRGQVEAILRECDEQQGKMTR
jgi:4-hydroxy-tetrahydrodipicolinate synthase